MLMEYARIIAYALITAACAFLAIEDHARRSFARWVWIALGWEHLVVLVLLAFDLHEIVAWMEARWFITPFAIASAVTLAIYAYVRRVERLRFRRSAQLLFSSYRQASGRTPENGRHAPPTL